MVVAVAAQVLSAQTEPHQQVGMVALVLHQQFLGGRWYTLEVAGAVFITLPLLEQAAQAVEEMALAMRLLQTQPLELQIQVVVAVAQKETGHKQAAPAAPVSSSFNTPLPHQPKQPALFRSQAVPYGYALLV